MDIFDDLPEPSLRPTGHDIATHENESSNIKGPCGISGAPSLFDDLPDASLANSNASSKVICKKRKSESDELMEEKKMKISEDTNVNSYCYELHGYFASRKGERDEMQDTHVILDNLTKRIDDKVTEIKRLAYYAVFDGHAGARASKFCEINMHKNILEKFPKGDASQIEKDMRKTLIDSYRRTDEEFIKEATKQRPAWKDGTTATTVLVVNDTVYTANIGDSKAILCRENNEGKQVALTLTKDHNPEIYEERMRIQKAGGVVRDGRVMGVLEVSRSIGDGPFKKQGVTCVPDIKRCQLTEKDRYLLIACDGLWKTMTAEEVVKIVQDVRGGQAKDTSISDDTNWDAVCSRLAAEAIRRLSGDNVTIIIVTIKQRES